MLSAKLIKNQILITPKLKYLYELVNPILFDVSLRDGIQGMKPEEMPYNKKLKIFNEIMQNMNPNSFEVGSLVSPKVLPIMKDSVTLYNECSQIIDNLNPVDELLISGNKEYKVPPDIYLLIPPKMEKIEEAAKIGIKNISLITSVSDEFMKKNTKMTTMQAKKVISDVYFNKFAKNVKLYLSCVNECPIDGRVDTVKIIENILFYEKYCDELCISDTCGTLSYKHYKIIIDSCIKQGINVEKISLHLHANSENYKNVENIIRYSLNKRIRRFDLSAQKEGGCSVTMNKSKIKNNLTYDTFYEILIKYLHDNYDGPKPNTFSNNNKEVNIKTNISYTQDYIDGYEEEKRMYA